MSSFYPTVLGSYVQEFTSGAVTTIAAGTSSAGHILALRQATAGEGSRIRKLSVQFLLTTAFGAAQKVGFDAYVVRAYSAAHTGGTALTLSGNDGKTVADLPSETLVGRIANTGALTAGTQTFDDNPIASDSLWCGAIGASFASPRCYDFTGSPQGGIVLLGGDGSTTCEGLVIRNSTLMGATGVGEWRFTVEWDRVKV